MNQSKQQFEVLQRASLFLQQNNCEPKIAEILLRHYLQMEQAQFFANMQAIVEPKVLKKFCQSVKQHVQTGVPVQHILGYEYFYNRKYFVNEHVLIPRPETEEVVKLAIEKIKQLPKGRQLSIVDLGTGSGIIAITLALEFPEATIYATDISEKALEIAQKNADQHNVEIHFMLGDFAAPLIEKQLQVQFIVSNPPYIDDTTKQTLARTVKDYDPEIALFAKNSGLAAYEKIIKQAKSLLAPKGVLVFEIGYDQGQSVSRLMNQYYPMSQVKVHKDINGQDRVVVAKIN